MHSMNKDLKAETVAVHALALTPATAGGAGDATEVDGVSLDTSAAAYKRPNSALFIVDAKATLAATKTLTITANLQDSANGSSWADITDPAVILTLTGAGGGSTETGVGVLGFDLSRARKYVRIQATPDLSATGTDTASIMGVAIFGGLSVSA